MVHGDQFSEQSSISSRVSLNFELARLVIEGLISLIRVYSGGGAPVTKVSSAAVPWR